MVLTTTKWPCCFVGALIIATDFWSKLDVTQNDFSNNRHCLKRCWWNQIFANKNCQKPIPANNLRKYKTKPNPKIILFQSISWISQDADLQIIFCLIRTANLMHFFNISIRQCPSSNLSSDDVICWPVHLQIQTSHPWLSFIWVDKNVVHIAANNHCHSTTPKCFWQFSRFNLKAQKTVSPKYHLVKSRLPVVKFYQEISINIIITKCYTTSSLLSMNGLHQPWSNRLQSSLCQ